MGEKESQVKQPVAPSVDLCLADPRAVWDAYLGGALLAQKAPRAYLELL